MGGFKIKIHDKIVYFAGSIQWQKVKFNIAFTNGFKRASWYYSAIVNTNSSHSFKSASSNIPIAPTYPSFGIIKIFLIFILYHRLNSPQYSHMPNAFECQNFLMSPNSWPAPLLDTKICCLIFYLKEALQPRLRMIIILCSRGQSCFLVCLESDWGSSLPF